MPVQKIRNTLTKLVLICSLLVGKTLSLTLIFDLNGVLFTTNTLACYKLLGNAVAWYYIHGNKPSQLKNKLYSIMNAACPNSYTSPHPARDDEGVNIPSLMQAWNRGTVTHQEILDSIGTYIAAHPHTFESETEQLLLWRLAQLIFDPYKFVKTRTLIPQMVDFVIECKNDGHLIFVLSNWDPTSFRILHNQYSQFFSQFDGIVISGTLGFIKPEPEIFTALINLYQLTPGNCIFFDDQKENIETARALGMHTILCAHTHSCTTRNRPNIRFIRQKYNFITQQLMPIGI